MMISKMKGRETGRDKPIQMSESSPLHLHDDRSNVIA